MDAREGRITRVAARLREEGLALLMVEDAEGRRDPSLRYLSGQPSDALLYVAADGRSWLVAWDVNMAAKYGKATEILAYTDFSRKPEEALKAVLARAGIAKGSRVELPAVTSYPAYGRYVAELEDYDLECREGGMDDFILGMRGVKDQAETALYRKVCALTDEIGEAIAEGVKKGSLLTETDVALYIERECRARGCEGVGFDTIAAGPARSFGIHAFPPYGAGPFAGKGMSILDFGIKMEGYTSDVTLTFVRGKPAPRQEEMIRLVQEAHDGAVERALPGVKSRDIALYVDGLFEAKGYKMPHALGHGIGLESHEAPIVRSREDNAAVLEPGNIITVEPGLYDPELGGVRLEDDILITEKGHEALTRSKIYFL